MRRALYTTSVVVRDQGVTIEAEWPDRDPEEVLSALTRAYEATLKIINDEKKKRDPMSEPLYPNVTVQLSGVAVRAIIGAVTQEMFRAGIGKEERDAFRDDAMSGDYDALLRTCMKWVTVQ